MITNSSGYFYTYDLYCGRTLGVNPTERLGTRVVKVQLNKLNTNANDNVVYFDISIYQLRIFSTDYDSTDTDLRQIGGLDHTYKNLPATEMCNVP